MTIPFKGVIGGRWVERCEASSFYALAKTWRKPRFVVTEDIDTYPSDYLDSIMAGVALMPQHIVMVTTRRPERIAEYMARKVDGYDDLDTRSRVAQAAVNIGQANDLPYTDDACDPWPLPNLWLCLSASTQAEIDAGVPHLLRCPAAVRVLSVDPVVEAVDLGVLEPSGWHVGCERCGGHALSDYVPKAGEECESKDSDGAPCGGSVVRCFVNGIDWLHISGDTGPNARPCNVEHVRSLVKQAKDACVPVWVESIGARPEVSARADAYRWGKDDATYLPLRSRTGSDPGEWPEDLRVREAPKQLLQETQQ